MDIFLFQLLLYFSLGLFVVSKKAKYFFTLALQAAVVIVTSYWAIRALTESEIVSLHFVKILNYDVFLTIDRMSAFFILVINLTMFTGILYAKGYLKSYYKSKNSTEFALHYFNFAWLHISMILVCALRDGLSFMVAWELMSLSSFFLVIFESEKDGVLKTGIKYLIQMHIGLAFLLTAFLVVYFKTGGDISFDSLALYFEHNSVFPLFLLFFIGFGIKAGFIPLHTWLPHAHPAAPSHVSGVMSGVMIKMGIYGILRVLTYIHTDLLNIGVFILSLSIISGLLGVILAIVQHDIKKLLAYHSIENIGIIGIGIGVGVIGIAIDNSILAVLGLAGAFLHVLNHSLFKSLLFYSAGSVYKQTHTRNIEQLGGLVKKMPKTALFFLLGAIAISGLPPFNGFISEFFIYSGMFKTLYTGDFSLSFILLAAIVSLALIGGLALFCFTKVFSIVFLGNERSAKTQHAHEVESSMLLPKIIASVFIVGIGILPVLIINPLAGIVKIFVGDVSALESIAPSLTGISLSLGVMLLVVAILFVIRSGVLKSRIVSNETTWGCGYTGANPATHQYTATSYADYIGNLTRYVSGVNKHYSPIEKDKIFPEKCDFKLHSSDIFEDKLITKPNKKLLAFLKKIAVFQTGNIQHYLLYAIVFIAIIFLLTIFNII
ncbi:MAG: proton-conducting transporter membrane subunit [Bacteroidota bacterium]|nr:proton-conducting transporter membrane subunit [Bacteroidota bacterium]